MKKRLEREDEQKLIGGVLAGLANYFDHDPKLFRLAAILLLVVTGIFPGLLLYIIAWVVMPRNDVRVDYEFE